MKDGRLTVRFSPVFQRWIAGLAEDDAVAVRALIVLGAAQIGLPGAQREALRLLESDMAAPLEDALLMLADTRRTRGGQVADSIPAGVEERREEVVEDSDPFGSLGIDV